MFGTDVRVWLSVRLHVLMVCGQHPEPTSSSCACPWPSTFSLVSFSISIPPFTAWILYTDYQTKNPSKCVCVWVFVSVCTCVCMFLF